MNIVEQRLQKMIREEKDRILASIKKFDQKMEETLADEQKIEETLAELHTQLKELDDLQFAGMTKLGDSGGKESPPTDMDYFHWAGESQPIESALRCRAEGGGGTDDAFLMWQAANYIDYLKQEGQRK